jgi:hypothetical protein
MLTSGEICSMDGGIKARCTICIALHESPFLSQTFIEGLVTLLEFVPFFGRKLLSEQTTRSSGPRKAGPSKVYDSSDY